MDKLKLNGKVFSARAYLLNTGKHDGLDRDWGNVRVMLALDVPFGIDSNFCITEGNELRECEVSVVFSEPDDAVTVDESDVIEEMTSDSGEAAE